MTIRVVVVDGHTLTRYGMAGLIADQLDIELVGEADTVAAGLRTVTLERPDVVTIDVTLPDGDGIRFARDLRDRAPALGIVLLTSRGEDDVLFRALESGVSAFVPKSAPTDEVLGAIRHSAVAASSFTAAGLALAMARRENAPDRLALSPREDQTLQYLGAGMSIPEIASTMFVSQSTAKTYVARLYEKLGASNRAQVLMTAMRYGLLRRELEEPA
jgi:DNA-binding NarL/FixJ family response regulator